MLSRDASPDDTFILVVKSFLMLICASSLVTSTGGHSAVTGSQGSVIGLKRHAVVLVVSIDCFPDLKCAVMQSSRFAIQRRLQQYQDENTALYFLVKESVIISGAYEALDRESKCDHPSKTL